MKKKFLAGLALLLPLIVTIWVVNFTIHLLTAPFSGIMAHLLETLPASQTHLYLPQARELLLYASRIFILILLFFTLVAVGWLARWYLIKQIIRLTDKVLHRIPMINRIYRVAQEAVNLLFSNEKKNAQKPVLVPFPHDKARMIGLAMRTLSATESPLGVESVSVLILGAPHPSLSFILLYRSEEVQAIDMSVEEAVKCIISCASLQTQLLLKEFHESNHLLLDHPP